MTESSFIFPFFFRPLTVGFIFGLVYFLLVSPIKQRKEADYKQNIGLNILIVFIGLPLGYFLFMNSLYDVSYISSLQTNSLFALFTFVICIITSMNLFGLFRLPDFSYRFRNSIFRSVLFIFDSNLYLFILNAYLISAYYDNDLNWFILILIGFIMALMFSNLKNYLRIIRT